jgi:hypothetical protein
MLFSRYLLVIDLCRYLLALPSGLDQIVTHLLQSVEVTITIIIIMQLLVTVQRQMVTGIGTGGTMRKTRGQWVFRWMGTRTVTPGTRKGTRGRKVTGIQ